MISKYLNSTSDLLFKYEIILDIKVCSHSLVIIITLMESSIFFNKNHIAAIKIYKANSRNVGFSEI